MDNFVLQTACDWPFVSTFATKINVYMLNSNKNALIL